MSTHQSKTAAQTTRVSGISTYLPPGAKILAATVLDRSVWYRKARIMRRDPTIGFLRDIFMAPALASEWTVEAEEERYKSAVDMVKKSFLPHRQKFLRDAFRGLLDYGWAGFELVRRQLPDCTLQITKMKSLLHDITEIVVNEHGEILGLLNTPYWSHQYHEPTRLWRGESLVLYHDAEGTNWYGEPLMKRAEVPYDGHYESELAARRFDNKVAGASWVIQYPVGTTMLNGVETDNARIASALGHTLQSSGVITIPLTVAKQIEDLNSIGQDKVTWSVQLVSAASTQANFVERGRYLDSLKCRAFGIPERAVTEGQFGTKAEAGEHADFAIDNQEMAHRDVVSQVNSQGVDPLLETNCGEEYVGMVKIKAAPLSSEKRAFFKQVYMAHLGNEGGQAEEADVLDMPAIRDVLELPTRTTQQTLHRGRYDPSGGPLRNPDPRQAVQEEAPPGEGRLQVPAGSAGIEATNGHGSH